MIELNNRPIIFFDGVCNLCDSSVQFILKRDKKEQFLFSSLQSDAARDILLHYNYKNNQLESLILLDEEGIFEKSEAIQRICLHLGNFWKIIATLISVLPKSWADGMYSFIARNRYKWFGKKDHCMIEVGTHKNRFI